jgi:soluble lytic murein transglycosylase
MSIKRLLTGLIVVSFGACEMFDLELSVKDLAQRYGTKHGHDPYLIEAIIWEESRGKPHAENPRSGAKGLMQLMDKTGRWLMDLTNREPDDYKPFDAELNVDLGCFYYRRLLRQFGDHKLTLAAYNWGEGKLSRLLRASIKDGEIQDYNAIEWKLPTETRKYVLNITTDWQARRSLHGN